MEVNFNPETEKKLKDLAAQSGRGTDDLVEDAMAGYAAELLQAREMLDSRYDDLKSGRVKPVPGDEVEAYFREKSAARAPLAARFMTGYDFHPVARLDLDEIWEYIRADSIDAADRMIAEILSAFAPRFRFPIEGHRRPDLTLRPLRFVQVREYLIAYAPDEKPLWVVAVMHGRRSPRVMAAIFRSRE